MLTKQFDESLNLLFEILQCPLLNKQVRELKISQLPFNVIYFCCNMIKN